MPNIFLSYRRDDTSGHAGRLFDRLKERFGDGSVFHDVSGSIAPATPFDEAIASAVESCDVLLALIGQRWLMPDAGGTPRLHSPKDFVHIEIAKALARGVPVIPVLVQNATMPAADQLPADLAPLAVRQAVELDDGRWDYDTERLVEALDKLPGGSAPRRVSDRVKWAVAGLAFLVLALVMWRLLPGGAAAPRLAWERAAQSPFAGGSGGDAKSVACPASTAVVGLQGSSAEAGTPGDPGISWIWDLRPTCAPVSLARVSRTRYEGRTGSPVPSADKIGGGGGAAFSVACPVNELMTAFDAESRLRAGGDARYLNFLLAQCGDIAVNRLADQWKVEIVTNGAMAPISQARLGGTRTRFSCADGAAGGDGTVTRLVAQAGTLVDGLAVGCSRAVVETEARTTKVLITLGSATLLAGLILGAGSLVERQPWLRSSGNRATRS